MEVLVQVMDLQAELVVMVALVVEVEVMQLIQEDQEILLQYHHLKEITEAVVVEVLVVMDVVEVAVAVLLIQEVQILVL